jgi:hypothetical protein
MIDKVSRDPLSVKMLALKGTDLITELGLAPSPVIGALLDVLLSEVIDDPERNTRPYLLKRASELMDLDLTKLRAIAAERIVAEKRKEEENIKKKHWVD